MSPAVHTLAPRDNCDPDIDDNCHGGLTPSTYAGVLAAVFLVILVLSCLVHRRRRRILSEVQHYPAGRPVIVISPRPVPVGVPAPPVFEPAPPYEHKPENQPIQYPPPSYSPG